MRMAIDLAAPRVIGIMQIPLLGVAVSRTGRPFGKGRPSTVYVVRRIALVAGSNIGMAEPHCVTPFVSSHIPKVGRAKAPVPQ
jgi:hypothetical protein